MDEKRFANRFASMHHRGLALEPLRVRLNQLLEAIAVWGVLGPRSQVSKIADPSDAYRTAEQGRLLLHCAHSDASALTPTYNRDALLID